MKFAGGIKCYGYDVTSSACVGLLRRFDFHDLWLRSTARAECQHGSPKQAAIALQGLQTHRQTLEDADEKADGIPHGAQIGSVKLFHGLQVDVIWQGEHAVHQAQRGIQLLLQDNHVSQQVRWPLLIWPWFPDQSFERSGHSCAVDSTLALHVDAHVSNAVMPHKQQAEKRMMFVSLHLSTLLVIARLHNLALATWAGYCR